MPRAAIAAGLVALAAGCTRNEPPAPDASPSVALPELRPASSATVSAAATTGLTPAPSASPTPPPSASAADPATLPQNHDHPPASGAAFDAGVAALWAGIVADDPEKAMPFFFPLAAYQQVKDVSDPGSDWKHRLVAAYGRDVHALHARLGADATRATFVGIDVPDAHARWVDPGEEYNKIGYFRVFSSRLRYTVDGEARSFEVKSLISWRGEWYVVHLGAIK
ncbi:MAG: hypothetical protein ABSE49_19585 [Polyangiaceae bacterium]|jgi:hypothetical protein